MRIKNNPFRYLTLLLIKYYHIMAKTSNNTFEQQLFKAADKLRKNIDAAEYKYVVLGLVFIKYPIKIRDA